MAALGEDAPVAAVEGGAGRPSGYFVVEDTTPVVPNVSELTSVPFGMT